MARTNFSGAFLGHADLYAARLRHTNFTNADLTGAILENVEIGDSTFKNSIGAKPCGIPPESPDFSFPDAPPELPEERSQPEFSSYYPELVQPGRSYALIVFAHLESVRDQVFGIAQGYPDMVGIQPGCGTVESLVTVELNSLITFVPRVQGIRFEPTEQFIAWTPPYQSATFLFTTSSNLSRELVGQILIYQGPLVIGEIPVTMKLQAENTILDKNLSQEGKFKRLDPVFASYSHRDVAVVEYFRRIRETRGQKTLVDIYDLQAGDYWAESLLKMIDECAVFQLFWSQNSQKSKHCRREWQYALNCKGHHSRFIQPVWWHAPMPPPPSELANLHFQKITVPPTTRMKLILGLFRDWRRNTRHERSIDKD